MFGVTHIVNILSGSRSSDVLRRYHDRVPQYGTGQEYAATHWRHLAEQFIRQGLLEQDMSHGGVRITTKGTAVLRGKGCS